MLSILRNLIRPHPHYTTKIHKKHKSYTASRQLLLFLLLVAHVKDDEIPLAKIIARKRLIVRQRLAVVAEPHPVRAECAPDNVLDPIAERRDQQRERQVRHRHHLAVHLPLGMFWMRRQLNIDRHRLVLYFRDRSVNEIIVTAIEFSVILTL